MTWEIEIEKAFAVKLPVEKTANDVLAETLRQLNCPYDARVSLLLTDDEAIREINRETRDIDRATDVLSFPANEFPAPGDFSEAEEFYPGTDELFLGDIVISTDRCREQAESFGHSLLREYAFLLTHSLLHLSGFDHMTDAQSKEMEQKQDEILNELGITR